MNSLPSRAVSRREALKTMGAGVALIGLGAISGRVLGAESAARESTRVASAALLAQPFTLPRLGYAYDALEPHIDARTMEIHHTKHHQGYIDNANRVLAEHPELQKRTAVELLRDLGAVPESVRGTLRNNVGGHVNHSLFWEILTPRGGGEPAGEFAAALTQAFGSFDAFRTRFSEAAMARFGSGWAWLSLRDGALQVHSTANQDSPFSAGATPIFGLDVWEHAYYLAYQNRRADYVKAFWNVVNWERAAETYRIARGA